MPFRSFVPKTLAAALALAMATVSASAQQTRRVVSLNLCADQLLLALADDAQIAALSPIGHDDSMSDLAVRARRFPVSDGSAEQAISLKPDLVLIGPYDNGSTREMLARQKVAFHVVDLWQDFAQGAETIRALAARLGQQARGEALIAAIEAERARIAPLGQGRTALAIGRGGYVDGKDSLIGVIMQSSGLKSLAPHPVAGSFVSLETLVTMRPDIVILADEGVYTGDRGAAFLKHPALAHWTAQHRLLTLPPSLTSCGGPSLIEAMKLLARQLAGS